MRDSISKVRQSLTHSTEEQQKNNNKKKKREKNGMKWNEMGDIGYVGCDSSSLNGLVCHVFNGTDAHHSMCNKMAQRNESFGRKLSQQMLRTLFDEHH